MVRPRRLQPGDTVAVLSPSWGGPALFGAQFDAGLRVLTEILELRVQEYPTTRMAPEELRRRPDLRARDLEAAFRDPSVAAIIASIGGDESIRLLPLLDPAVGREHPTLLMGFSDITTLLVFYADAGLVTFHGPTVMAGIAQLPAGPPEALEHVRAALFGADDGRELRPYGEFFDGYPDWSEQTGALNPPRPAPGWRSIQGSERARGHLWGGCGEVLDFLRGTPWWPRPDQFTDCLLLLETSEEAPPPVAVERWLRTFGVCGVFDRLAGLLFGRPRDYTGEMRIELEERVLAVVADEFGASNLPIVMDLDFGHTDPQLVLPLGIDAELDVAAQRLRLLEAPLI